MADREDAGQWATFAYEPIAGILAIAVEKKIRFVQLPNKELGKWQAPYWVSALAFSADGKALAIGYGNIAGTSDDADNAGRIQIVPFSMKESKH